MASPIETEHERKKHRAHKEHQQASEPEPALLLPAHGTIPVTQVNCTGYQLDECAVEAAKDRAVDWGAMYVVPRRGLKYWEDGGRTAGWWICNCKLARGDPVVREELDECLAILADRCGGPYRSGWVWSDEWQKSFNLAPAWERGHGGEQEEGADDAPPAAMPPGACPPGCVEAGNPFGLG